MTKTIENGQELTQLVVEQYSTMDPFLLAELAGIKVDYARWHPISWGEYDSRSRSICLNLNAPIPLEQILAHELGHYFVQQFLGKNNRKEEELLASDFATGLFSYSTNVHFSMKILSVWGKD